MFILGFVRILILEVFAMHAFLEPTAWVHGSQRGPAGAPATGEGPPLREGGDAGPDGPPGQPKTKTRGERSRKKGGIFRPRNWGHG